MSYCNQCGKEMDEDMSFCVFCGAPVPTARAAESRPAVPEVTYAAPSSPAPQLAYNTAPPVYSAPPAYGISAPAAPRPSNFVSSYLIIVVLAGFFVITLGTGIILTSNFVMPQNLLNVFRQICIFGPVAFAMTITARAKGPDISIGSMMALSSIIIALTFRSFGGSLILSGLISIVLCGAVGLLNGVLTTYLRIPAVITTLLTSILIQGVCLMLAGGGLIQANYPILQYIAVGTIGGLPVGAIVLLLVAFIAAFLMILLTKLGVPMHKREKKSERSYMFAYMASAIIASLTGLFLLARTGGAHASFGSGYEPYLLTVFACVTGSRILDNRVAPAIFAIAPAIFFAILSNLMNLLAADYYTQLIVNGVIALIFIVIAYIARRFGSHGITESL